MNGQFSPMQTYELETIDAAPCWRVYVEGRKTNAYIPVIGNRAPPGMGAEQVEQHNEINKNDDEKQF